MGDAKAYLKPLTQEAELALHTSLFEIPKFPFSVGRESRIERSKGFFGFEKRKSESIPTNDLYILEKGKVHNISREHFSIEKREGGFFFVDKKSTCGSIVEGVYIGGDNKGGEKVLSHQDVIIVGTSRSEFIFKFLVGS